MVTHLNNHSRKRPVGRWVVLRAGGYDPENPWVTILWGGDGEHPLDCAEWETWESAWNALVAEGITTGGVSK